MVADGAAANSLTNPTFKSDFDLVPTLKSDFDLGPIKKVGF